MGFKQREFTLLGMKPGNAAAVLSKYVAEDRNGFWEEFVSSLETAHPMTSNEDFEHAVFVCVYEGFLREFALKVLQKGDTVEEVASSMQVFVKLMGVDTASKTS